MVIAIVTSTSVSIAIVIAVRIRVELGELKVIEGDPVELLTAFGRVSFPVDIHSGCLTEPVPSLCVPADLLQRVGVGVIEASMLRPNPPARQLRALQGDHSGVQQALIAPDAGLDDAQLDLRRVIGRSRIRAGDKVEGAIKPT